MHRGPRPHHRLSIYLGTDASGWSWNFDRCVHLHASGAGGLEFKSRRSDQLKTPINKANNGCWRERSDLLFLRSLPMSLPIQSVTGNEIG